ncbi:zinc-binding protein A33-like [Chanos chanos]|uniref:Zinc-binding protein A33-like n=1 Tax=Chanos chanos TaxID=29144 RepID=A0A6J2WCU1_CHACN|nr:zinc-binding protein A33-like [Chanos chanos]
MYSDCVVFRNELTAIQLQSQANKTEGQIKEEFEKLHKFLHEEEAARIAKLREEEALKSKMLEDSIETIGEKLACLTETIENVEKEMETEDMSFLESFKDIKRRVQCTLEDPETIPVPLIDVSKHLSSLKYQVWEKMMSIVQYVPLTLDPLSAHPQLSLSEELTSVRYSFRGKSLPDNPERFDLYVFVLGVQGYGSGAHSWEVEVGNKPNCRIGVACRSVRRKGNFSICPKEGFYTIVIRNREFRAGTAPETRLDFHKRPQRIRVCVDCDKGEVSFIDPSENTLIYTFKDVFTEELYPFFGPSKDSAPLRICPISVSVKCDL